MPELIGFRVAAWDTPLRVHPNRQAGRYNRAQSPPTQYIALHPLGSWAEYIRWHGLHEPEQLRPIRLGVWVLKVSAPNLIALDFDNAEQHGLRPEDLVADDWNRCQIFAEALRTDPVHPKALLVPSAALPGTRNLVLFGARVAMPYSLVPLDENDIPTTLCAAGAQPPQSLLELVRQRGQEHAELSAWQRGERYHLIEPPDALLADDLRP
jgi:RES domain-containing protein